MNTVTRLSMICLGFLVSCNSGGQKEGEQSNDTLSQADPLLTVDQEQKYCFLRTEGTEQQDSSFLQLTIRNETVNGIYNVIPHEKDARRGTVLGKAAGEVLDLVWTFTQEGMQDTLRVVFKLQNGTLVRKPFSVDTSNGRQVTLDSSGFLEAYEAVDCVEEP
ncbi:hypothetical protein [Parapedobacter tibetensis]|uniref:hypothetical protein n=1 Tax=Parapedobacter tibetensis TaxID=2972951 RepID=UPI00214DAC18|nr:hypothetical protein [Parapedobacter tibetensis]